MESGNDQGAPERGAASECCDAHVPLATRRRWDAASAELSNLVLAAPDLYERAMILVRRTADLLREQCPDLSSLLRTADHAEAAGVTTVGLRLDLVASAALAIRSREIADERTRRTRLGRVSAARGERRAWAVVEEQGEAEAALLAPYRRTEVHVATGVALVASAEPDETFARVVYRMGWARLDLGTGRLRTDEGLPAQPEEYGDRRAWEAALAQARRRLA